MTNLPSDHEHDDDGNCIVPEGFQALPSWRFSGWDIAGIAATGIGGLFAVVGQALNLVATECAAMANYSRQNHDLREARKAYEAHQRQISEALHEFVNGDDS